MIPKRLTSGAPLVRALSSKNSISQPLSSIGFNPGVSLTGDSALRRVLRSQVGPTTEFFALGGTSRHLKILQMDQNKKIINEFAFLKQTPKHAKRAVFEPASLEPADGDTGSVAQSSIESTEMVVPPAPEDSATGVVPHQLSLTAASSAFCKLPSSGTQDINQDRTIVTAGDDNLLMMDNIIAVADGLGCYERGKTMDIHGIEYRTDSQLFSYQLLHCLAKAAKEDPSSSPAELVQKGYKKASFRCNSNKIIGASTAVVACINDNHLNIAHIGDSEGIVIRNGSIVFEANDNDARGLAFNTTNALNSHDRKMKLLRNLKTQKFLLQENDIIVLATDGVFDNLFKEQLIPFVAHLNASSTSKEVEKAAQDINDEVLHFQRSKTEPTPWSMHVASHNRSFTGGKIDDTSLIVAVVKKKDEQSL